MRDGKAWRPERVAVIGLGRFGTATAVELGELGYDVTAIDIDEQRVADVADRVVLAVQGDGTNEEVLRSLSVEKSDVCIVAQGSNVEVSALVTLLLKRMGVPWVVAKASTTLHGALLSRIGADRVIYPERDTGVRVAHSLAARQISDYISLSPTSGIAKLDTPAHFVGKTLDELDIEKHYQLNLVLIKRGSRLIVAPDYRERIAVGDELVLVGPDHVIATFTESQPSGRPG